MVHGISVRQNCIRILDFRNVCPDFDAVSAWLAAFGRSAVVEGYHPISLSHDPAEVWRYGGHDNRISIAGGTGPSSCQLVVSWRSLRHPSVGSAEPFVERFPGPPAIPFAADKR